MTSKPKKAPTCAWPRCGKHVSEHDYVPVVGSNTGRIYACAAHRDRIAIGKAVVGTGLVAAFREGMDRAAPGLREKIGDLGTALFDVVQTARQSKDERREPAE